MLRNFLAGKASKTTLFNFLPKVLPGETLCKLVQIFPPKVLVYIRKVFLDTIESQLFELNKLIEMKNNCCMCILNCFIRDTIKITRKIEVFNTQNNKLKIHLEKFFKKTGACVF